MLSALPSCLLKQKTSLTASEPATPVLNADISTYYTTIEVLCCEL